MGQYQAALDIFNHALPVAERLGLDVEAAEILIFILRTRFMMGDLRKFAPACLHLTTICERIRDFRPLAEIIEPATHAYINEGQVDKALEMVQTHLKHLKEKDDQKSEMETLICEMLLVRIYQVMGRWDEAADHSEMAHSQLKELSGQSRMAESAEQVHLLYYIDSVAHQKGPEIALAELDQLIDDNSFSGFLIHDAYFQVFRLAVSSNNVEMVEKYLPRCQQNLPKVAVGDRLSFFSDLAKHYLDCNRLTQAHKTLKSGSSLFHLVSNRIPRGQFLDQQARLAARQGNKELAFKRWNQADEEFQQNLKSWKDEDREVFKENAPAWQEHRVIYMLLQAGLD